MIHNRPRPALVEAHKVDCLSSIVRTLNDLPVHLESNVSLFTDGVHVVLVDTSGYDYPRYKTPKIKVEDYDKLSDFVLENALVCKASGSEVDYELKV